jgi:hypothetical protein
VWIPVFTLVRQAETRTVTPRIKTEALTQYLQYFMWYNISLVTYEV